MRHRPWFAFVLCLVAVAGPAAAGIIQPRVTDLAAKCEAGTLVLGPTRRVAFGTYNGTILLYESRNGQLVKVMQRYLWSPVLEMIAVDLDHDGQDEIVGHTMNARLFVLRAVDLGDIWNTPERRYQSIRTVAAGDVDDDGQIEILLIADDRLRIYNGLRDIIIWESQNTYTDTEMCVGNVDDDGGKPEIVFNRGRVLDAVFREVEWTYEPGFGNEIDLFDIDSDGMLEIIGVGADGLIRVFDVDERRVKID
jgi:hypothetical protein